MFHMHWLKDDHVKLSVLLKRDQQIQCTLYQTLNDTSYRNRRKIVKFIWNFKGPWITKTIFKKKKRQQASHSSISKHITKQQKLRQQYWHKDRHTDQQKRIEGPETNACIHGQMIFNKGAETIQWREGSLFKKWCWENQIPHAKV